MSRFLVWNPAAGMPTTSHATMDIAVKESERLAKLHPGQRFHVMAPIGSSCVDPERIFKADDAWNYIPF